jgi:hypothetical protein
MHIAFETTTDRLAIPINQIIDIASVNKSSDETPDSFITK